MVEADRVALVGWIWFIAWIAAGDAVGRWVFACPGTGLVLGFLFALATLMVWPWVLPPLIDEWMHEQPPPSEARRRHWWPRSLTEREAIAGENRDLRRVAFVAALWFAFWMIAASVVGGVMSKQGLAIEGAYDGFFNGAWWALLTSFAWPWFMPTAVDRWMYRSPVG